MCFVYVYNIQILQLARPQPQPQLQTTRQDWKILENPPGCVMRLLVDVDVGCNARLGFIGNDRD